MTIQEECALSFYRELAPLHEKHGVYLVRHVQTGKLCVKKQLTVYNKTVYDRLKTEPIPGLPRIYEAVEDGGVLTVIEDYLHGETLAACLEREKTLPPARAADLMGQLCAIVSRLHKAKPAIIHRDIKPANIMLVEDRVYLLDLNAARQDCGAGTQDTALIGTAGYAAPEQYGFGTSDERTDIYALGVLYHEMLTGERELSTPVRGTAGRVIRRCTRLKPGERYASADALRKALPGSSLHRYLLPGFRTATWWKMIPAVCYYFVVLIVLTTARVQPLSPLWLDWLNRGVVALMLLSFALFTCNYLQVQDRLRFPRTWVRVPLILAGDTVLFFAGFFISTVLERLGGVVR